MIQSNQKFPDMKALADYIHSKGLKFGIYLLARAPHLCELRGKFRARGSGRRAIRQLGGGLREV